MRIFLMLFACLSIFIVTPARALCLWNCTPSDSRVCSAFKTEFKGTAKYPAEVVGCRKVNGEELNMLGATMYRMYLEVTVRYPQGNFPECITNPHMPACYMLVGQKPMPVGATDTRQIDVMFRKTEQGWADETGRIY
jgi:hypothetical protein